MVGIEKSDIYPFLKYYMGWYIIIFGGDISEDMEFGADNCIFEFSTMMHIM